MLGRGSTVENPSHPWEGANRLVVFGNPSSSRFAEAYNKLEQVQIEHPEILNGIGINETEIVETNPECAKNQALFSELSGTDAVAVIGGDGTVSAMLKAAHKTGYARSIALLGGGNANDIERMANGRKHKNLAAILSQTVGRTVYPLKIDAYQDALLPIHKLAFGYFSLGYTAVMSAKLNDAKYRERTSSYRPSVRLINEVGTLISALGKAPHFVINDEEGSRLAQEQVFMNGSRMAKHMRSQQSLFEAGAVHAELPRAELLTIGIGLARLALGRTAKLEDGGAYKALIFPQSEDLRIEVDGESGTGDILSSPTRLIVQPDTRGVMLLTTK